MSTIQRHFSTSDLNFGQTKLVGLLKVIALSIALSVSTIAAQADERLSEEQIKELALEAILENPEVLRKALARLEEMEAERRSNLIKSTLTDRKNDLQNDDNAPVIGNPEGDVTIVEFFDYNCPFCRRVKPEISALLASDKNVRLVFREWPILGEGSVFAAKAALAARKQDKYEAFHWALMALDIPADEVTVLRVAEEVGLDINQLKSDANSPEVEDHIAKSMELASLLGITGTPTFVFDDAVVPGLVNADRLSAEIGRLRSQSKSN